MAEVEITKRTAQRDQVQIDPRFESRGISYRPNNSRSSRTVSGNTGATRGPKKIANYHKRPTNRMSENP